jgi:hypothetical protein
MIERAIENWLTNTSERYYQTAFCQVLLYKGHRLLHRSTHGQLEQGKDIITLGPSGECHAYQLKTGNIDLAYWRRIKGEIEELMELPVIHPEIDKSRLHKSFVVTNGYINDTVRVQIDQRNEDNARKGRNYSYLSVMSLPELLKGFLEAQGKFIPTELRNFHDFLRFYTSDGREMIDKELLLRILYDAFFAYAPERPSEAQNVISSSVILTSYLLNQFQHFQNHFALFEGWLCLGACILRYALRYNLEQKLISDSWQLVMTEILSNLENLSKETFARPDYLEGDIIGDGAFVYGCRKTIVLGCLSALELHRCDLSEQYCVDTGIINKIKEGLPLEFSAEVFFPFIFCIVRTLEKAGEIDLASGLLRSIFTDIIKNNSSNRDIGFPNPYYSVSDLLADGYGLDTRKMDLSEFPGSSYTLGSMIHMLARRKEKNILEEWWKPLSHIALMQFKPDSDEDIFLWRCEKGVNLTECLEAPQSWKKLCMLAEDSSGTSDFLTQYKQFLRFFILVFPHRANIVTIRVLDS